MSAAFPSYVNVFSKGTQRDSTTGQDVGSPAPKLSGVACNIQTVSGGEVRRGQQMQADTNKLVTFPHFYDQITTDDKLVRLDGEAEINILAAYDKTGERKELWIEGRSKA